MTHDPVWISLGGASAKRAAVALLFALLSRFCFGSGYEFEGVGAREVARGGAAIADSANWTAIYWNPANLRRAVEKDRANIGVEVFGGKAHGTDSNSLSSLPVGAAFDRQHLSSNFLLGAAGAAIRAGRFGLGIGVYTPLLQGVDFSDNSPAGLALHHEASAGIVTASLEAALNVTPRLYAGAGVDVLYGRITSASTLSPFPVAGNTATSRLRGDGVGVEGIFGLRYDAGEKWTFGAVYRTGADVPVRGRATVTNTFFPEESSDFRYSLRHPATSGLGVAFRPAERWSLEGDFTQTYWRRFTNAFSYDQQGLFLQDSGNSFHWRNTWKARLGAGFQATPATELLGGYSFDRHALDPASVDFASAIDVPMNRLYTGAAHRWSPRWETVAGAVYGWGHRSEGGVHYRLTGWQVMLESQFRI
jgi:long-chain fatty acid transport protein